MCDDDASQFARRRRCTLILESHVNALGLKKMHDDLMAGEQLMSRARELVDSTDGPLDGCSRT